MDENNREEINYTNSTEPKRKLPFWLGLLIGIFCTIIVASVASTIFLRAARVSTSSDAAYSEKIDYIVSMLKTYYTGELTDEMIEEALADGLLDGIGDRYAKYYTAEEYAALIESNSGSYAGIGVQITQKEEDNPKTITVTKVFSNSPSEAVGIQIGDVIVEVDGYRDFEDMDELVSLVRGEVGTTVEIVVDRNGTEITFTIERASVTVDTVEYKVLDGNIGYIKIEEFDYITDEQFDEALTTLENMGISSLIFDLRDNPGGDYDTVVAMCDRVLPEGVIMTVRDNQGNIQTENSTDDEQVTLPLVVLINENSASASEVFTGAIQDYNMATIIGTQSYGKGVVQSIFPMSDGSGMKFTTMNYYTPSGDSVDGVGITPDIVVELPEDAYDDGILSEEEDTQLARAIEVLTSGTAGGAVAAD